MRLKKTLSRPLIISLLVVSAIVLCTSGLQAVFTNGGFEAGDLTGWTVTTYLNPGLSGAKPFTGADINRTAGGINRTAVQGPWATMSQTDASTQNNLHYPYVGSYCAVVNFQGSSRNANSIVQETTTTSADVLSDGNIHVQFAWAAVVQQPGHAAHEQPYVYMSVTNTTQSTLLYEKFYLSDPTDPIWYSVPGGSVLYTDWHIENQAYTPAQVAVGDKVQVECIASGCSQSGHWGYLYVDAFGADAPPEPCNRPTVTSIRPSSGSQGQNLEVTITGTYFTNPSSVSFSGSGVTASDAGVTFVSPTELKEDIITDTAVSFSVSDVTAPDAGVTFVSPTELRANVIITDTAALGARHVRVTTPCATGTLVNGFTVVGPLPTITAVNASGMQGQGPLTIVITGTNFTGATGVSFGTGITVSSFTVDSATQITAIIYIANDATVGARNISVTNADGTGTGSFTVIQRIQSIGTGAPTSHGSSVSAPTSYAPPVSLPNLVIQSASLSATTVTPGTPITVTADIANKSTVNGNKKVTLYVNGQVETTQGVTVNSGGSSKLTFNVSRSEPGDYTVYVDGVPAGSFKVELFRESDGMLIFSAVLVALAFLIGMVMLWRRQKRAV